MPTPSPLQPAKPAPTRPATDTIGVAVGAGMLVILGSILVGLGGIVLGLGLGSAWVLLTSAISLPVGFLMGMAGLFGALSYDRSTGSRFNLVRGLGLVVGLSGLALGWYLGGLLGVGVGLVLLGLGSFLTGLGLAIGAEYAEPSRSLPVNK